MKKIFLIIICVALMIPVFSQDAGNTGSAGTPVNNDNGFKKFRFGIKIYPALSWIKSNEKFYKKEGMKFGFGYGISTEIGIAKNYSFLTGIELQNIGGKISFPNMIEDDSTNYTGNTLANVKLSYVNLPLQLKLKTNQIGEITYFANIGFELGVKYKATADYTNTFDMPGKDKTTEPKVNISDKTGLFRAGLVFGAGLEYNISGNTSLVIGASFNNGFLDLFTKKWQNYETTDKGIVTLDKNLKATDKSGAPKAITNFVALNVGIYF